MQEVGALYEPTWLLDLPQPDSTEQGSKRAARRGCHDLGGDTVLEVSSERCFRNFGLF